MTTAADIRAEARRRVREAMLDAAYETAVAHGWGALRMGVVAARVGVSRQTLHAEFGTKESLGQALVLRETERFLTGVTTVLDRHPDDLRAGLAAAVEHTLRATAAEPLLQTILTGARTGGDETLLPLLTSRSEPLLHLSTDVLAEWVRTHRPDLAAEAVDDAVDSVVRLVVSHAVAPGDDAHVVGQRLARLAATVLGL